MTGVRKGDRIANFYARLAALHRARPTVPDHGGGVKGDRYPLDSFPGKQHVLPRPKGPRPDPAPQPPQGGLREALERAIKLVRNSDKGNLHASYRQGWLDALEAIASDPAIDALERALAEVRAWVDDHDWRGAEGRIVVYDALVAALAATPVGEGEHWRGADGGERE